MQTDPILLLANIGYNKYRWRRMERDGVGVSIATEIEIGEALNPTNLNN